MRQRVRFTGILALAAIGTVALSSCGLLAGKTFQDDATVSRKITSVRLDSGSGGLTVRGGKGGSTVAVHRAVSYHGARPEGAGHRVEGGVLVLSGCGRNCSVDYTLDLPAGIPVSGRTSSGSVELSKVGPVKVTTSSGDIRLDGVTGTVDARTSNGRITGHGLSGARITAETSNGAIDLTPATAQNLRAKTSNGAIRLRLPKGPYRVSAETGNGEEHIGIAQDPAARFQLDLTTSNGDITANAA
ncbi:DUF4097 family beta strand repeat-containing protein [Streptomyces sp. NPDC048611]|uniref:DUF4097 family beta strand repeat-containing protein n=1 Tax=unclassified Streptomyces TaxID=2593676 RepID=UPI00343E045E